jgi:translation initiation factor 6
MVIKIKYQRSDLIGVYMKLTNSFCIIPHDTPANFYKSTKNELYNKIPIITTSILGSRSVGRLIIGNKKGIVVPYQTTIEEFENLKKFLPEEILIKRCDDKFSALANSVSANDYTALVNPEISLQTVELISDVLGVEIFRMSIGKENLVGSYCIFNNNGGIIHPSVQFEEQDELSSLLEIPLLIGTVNCGNKLVGSGISTNDWAAFCGLSTTQSELFVIETALMKKE